MMNATRPPKNCKTHVALALVAVGLSAGISLAHAESLFRAGISYQTAQPYTPRSLFSLPRPATVGDMVTVNITQNTKVAVENTATLSKQQDIQENSSQTFNNIIKKLTGFKQVFPSIDGAHNVHQDNVTAKSKKTYTYNDTITCQVVQVLPNGYLVVQGKKTVFADQEEQDLYVGGIVNPYYLDASNAIASNQVANLQMHVAGKGQISRQQGDGVLGKYFQILN